MRPDCEIGTGLTHGVTVALLILVQSVKVRILMGQHYKPLIKLIINYVSGFLFECGAECGAVLFILKLKMHGFLNVLIKV